MKFAKIISIFCTMLFAASGYAGDNNKVDWGICKVDLESTGCMAKNDDHEKHECLEKTPKGKISKGCKEHNHKLENEFSKKHHSEQKH